jgi:probable addiction module antidote protein
MPEYRTLDDVTIAYYRTHPEEIEPFLQESFAEYARGGDSAALLEDLRIIARVQGISQMAAAIGMSRQGLQKALSAKGNPRLDTINAIMRALGYQLMPVEAKQPSHPQTI